MAPRKVHPALRHGLYSALTVLPGEDYAAFQKLYRHLVEEYAPSGVSEFELVQNIARLMWRKKNLATYYLAYLARRYCDNVIEGKLVGRREAQAREKAEQEVREELGPEGRLLDLKDDHQAMMGDLTVHEKLDAMIARNIKQLFLVKGLKTVGGLGPSATAKKQQVVETRAGLRLATPAPGTSETPPPQVALKR
jgi:hypothetical protein